VTTIYEFRADVKRREVSGLIVPWNQAASSGGVRWRFNFGSLWWSAVERVKLLRDHDLHQPLGKAVELSNRDDGLFGRFAVARGEAGDQALELAADGTLDGLSAGPLLGDSSARWVRDADGVRAVSHARLVEVSLTAVPSFDDSRLERVSFVGRGINPVYVQRRPALRMDQFGSRAGGGGFSIGVRRERGFYE
jgi:HK97 family phage prohead protease